MTYRIGDVIRSDWIHGKVKNANIGVINSIRQTFFNDYIYLIKVINERGNVKCYELFAELLEKQSELCRI
jgi:hypothetical protein